MLFGRLLIATLTWGVLAFGAVYPWAYWPLIAAAVALGAWGAWSTRAWTDPRVRRLALAVGVVLVAIAVQVIALPYWLLEQISPNVDAFLRSFSIGYHPAALHALSLDPGATAVVLALGFGLGVLLVGTTRAIRRVPLEWLATQVMGLGVTVAVVGIVQKALLDPSRDMVYGFWKTRDGGQIFGPFVNRNHFAGWMVMALPVVVAYGMAAAQRSGRRAPDGVGGWLRWAGGVEGNRFLLISTAALVMAAAVVLTGSRSGIVSLLVAVGALAAFLLRRLPKRRTQLAVVTYLMVVVLGATAWAGSDLILSRFQAAPGEIHGRLGAWSDTIDIIQDFPIFGVGLGGYRRAMLIYQTTDRSTMYAQAHNDYLQLAAEGGLLVTLPAIALAAIVLVDARRRFAVGDTDPMAYWLRRGAAAGLLGIAAQSLVDFSLQMPGNTLLFVVLLAIVLHRPGPLTHAHRV